MFWRKSATQTENLLEYLANAQQEQQLKSKRQIAQTAVVDEKNAELATATRRLENLLSDALAQDSCIDLDSLKKTPRIPAFNKQKPVRRGYLPKPPSGFASLLPWKRRAYDRLYEAAEAKYRKDRRAYDEAQDKHEKRVAQERVEIEEHNREIERFKQDFDAGVPKEIENYFTLVLEKSAYPAGFPNGTAVISAVDTETLRIDFTLPAIDVIPGAKAYAYDKIRDAITQTAMPQKQRRSLYAAVLAQISLRAIHEVFTADRTNKINSVIFVGYVDGRNPSTGQPGRFCLVALNVTRQHFDRLDLRRVEPRACLSGLNGRLSSEPDQMLAVPPMMRDDYQDATVADEPDIHYFKQRISELEGKIQTQGAQIADLNTKLAARRDKNGELASTLRDKQAVIADLESNLEAHRDRIAELVPDLRDEKERNAELFARIQEQRERIAELESPIEARKDAVAEPESQPPEEPDDTKPIEAFGEIAAGSELSEAAAFTPIASDSGDDGVGGAPIPPRQPEQQANQSIAKPDLFEVMSVFIEARGRYVDYIGAGLSKEHINRLVRDGRLERHRFHTYKLRATLAGNIWYRERSEHGASPIEESEESLSERAPAVEAPVTLRSLLLGEADEDVAESSAAEGPASQPTDEGELTLEMPVLTEPTERATLIEIIGRPHSDSARLLALMMKSGWRSNEDALQPAFPDEFVNVIVDEINERAFDSIGENLIYEEGGYLIGHEDYCQDLESIFALPVYQHLRHR